MDLIKEILNKEIGHEKLELLLAAHKEHDIEALKELRHFEHHIAKDYLLIRKFKEEKEILELEIAAHHHVSPELLERIAHVRAHIQLRKALIKHRIEMIALIHCEFEKLKFLKSFKDLQEEI